MGFSATERKAAIGLATVFSTRMIGLFMIMPVFAIYGPRLEGFTPLWMGLAIGVYGLTQACLQIPMGHLSDRIGRKPVIYAGLVIFAIGSLVAALADNIFWVTIGRALQGAGAISSAVLALAADLSRDHQRPKVMAIIGVFIGLSFTVALIIGPLIAGPFGLSGLFWATAGLALLAMASVKFLVPDAVTKAPSGDTMAKWPMMKALVKDGQLWRLNSAVLVIHFCMTCLFTVLPSLLVSDETSSQGMWQVLLPILLLSFLTLIPMMKVFNRRGLYKQGLIFSAILMTISVIMLSIGSQQWLIWVATVLYFAGFNYLEAGLPSMVSLFSPAGHKGSAMGVFTTCQFGGAFLGGVTAGILLQWQGSDAVFITMAIVLLSWTVFALSMQTRAKLKALHLPVSSSTPESTWLELLTQQPGVAEAVYVPEEQVVYLKVNQDKFDIQCAEALIHAASVNIEEN
ncbi:MFS transporter [Echinimonas agarilytica]|uniref:MFS transporter n=1 Tax=Echinimonas agarilytica TaxID=1215918 RepID=A0AA41W4L4_9GAMM|nr:MFS transporter [Echinimonas agarilytica]MCM2678554.1 MFS transporter [Echinimonas agarilytica]